MARFAEFFENLLQYGMEYFRRYYGPYRARVKDNNDPKRIGRVRVSCPRARLKASAGDWLMPMMSGSGQGHGVFWPPEIGDVVWIFFDNGDPTAPACYMGGWYKTGEVHPELKPGSDGPLKKGVATPAGHTVVLDDTSGSEKISIKHKDGSVVEWTDDGKVRCGKEGGPFEPMMKGETVKRWLESHTHSHSWGPTGVPIQPFPQNGLSDDSETS